MLEKTKGIVLSNTNFRDNSIISHIYTQDFGRQSYMLNGVRNQKGAIRPSHVMPLTLLDLVIYHKPSSQIQQIKELRCEPILKSVHFDVFKNSIALFVAEVLNAVLREEEPNPRMFQFLSHFIHILDLEEGRVANYPSYFLIQLSRYLGFYPKGNFTENSIFNLVEGVFMEDAIAGDSCLTTSESDLWWKIMNSNLDTWSEVQISPNIRSALLTHLLTYYQIHGLHGHKIKSHLVLREVLR
jgi:DNA repair protein RecO (recombination protein O)